jgi:hypothetical protein
MSECEASSLLERTVFIFVAKKSNTSAGLLGSEDEGVTALKT